MALPIKMILVPMQLDDPEAAALRVAKRLAQENDASICAMHVIPIEPLEITPGTPTDIYARDLEKAKEDLQRITDQHLGGIKHQLATQFAAQRRIEVGERLVEQEQRRPPHQRAAQRDALTLATGQLGGLAFETVSHAEKVRHLAEPVRRHAGTLIHPLPLAGAARGIFLGRCQEILS